MIQFAAALGSTPSAIVRSNRSVDVRIGDQRARHLGLEAELGRVALAPDASGALAASRESVDPFAAATSGGRSGSGK